MVRQQVRPASQLEFPSLSQPESSAPQSTPVSVTVAVDPTFDVGQGLREIKTHVGAGGNVTFDWCHLALAHEYMGGAPDPFEPFVTERGGLVSLATPMNVFRVQGTATRWAHSRGVPISFSHVPPQSDTPARRLYDVLAVEQASRAMSGQSPMETTYSHPEEFQSRYVSPIILVDGRSKARSIQHGTEWIAAVQQTGQLHFDLLKLLPEVVTNLVNHGLSGSLLLSIWPLGQVDVLWCNRIRTGDPIFSDATARDAAARISHTSAGSGLSFIMDDLLLKYAGALCVNFNGADVVFYAGDRVELYHAERRSDHFIPDSVLFTLCLYSADAQRKGN